MDLERQKKNFKDHVATFTDHGNIKILDFKRPDSSEYRMRFMFEEDYCRLHISGDLGELIATNYNNMTFEKFADFVRDTGYFEEKIDCHSRKIYTYDEDKARDDLTELFNEFEIDDLLRNSYYDDIDEVIDDVLEDFDSDRGIGSKGCDILCEMDDNAWEYVENIGRENTNILELYMLAFELAMEQINRK